MNAKNNNGWIETSAHEPCPVCDRRERDCAISLDRSTVLCKTKAVGSEKYATPPDVINGFTFTGKINTSGVHDRAIYKAEGAASAPFQTPSPHSASPKPKAKKSMPVAKKHHEPKQQQIFLYPNADGSPLCRVQRSDTGEGTKFVWQEYWIEDDRLSAYRSDGFWVQVSAAKVKSGRASNEDRELYLELVEPLQRQIGLYRIDEAIALHQSSGLPLLIVEGEGKANSLLDLGIPATCAIGGAEKWNHYGGAAGVYAENLSSVEESNIVLVPDRDKSGMRHCEQIAADYPGARWLFADPKNEAWVNPVDAWDIKNWIDEMRGSGSSDEDIKAAIVGAIGVAHAVKSEPKVEAKAKSKDVPAIAEGSAVILTFPQVVVKELYSDRPWICVSEELYAWTGNHYEYRPKAEEKRRIAAFANEYQVWNSKKKAFETPYATPYHVDSAFGWLKTMFPVSPKLCNPPGINCTNGVLTLEWKEVPVGEKDIKRVPSFRLIPHTPDLYYLYKPNAKFDPEADAEMADRLLEALNPAEQEVLLRTIAAAFDLKTVRKTQWEIRAILAKGTGANGKDAHREAFRLMWGETGMTGVSFEDFEQYDDGRKFPLSGLQTALINWASENRKGIRLDNLQSLKKFVTGDSLTWEGKGKDHFEYVPNAIGIFNVNDVPNLTASQEAIGRRFAILSYDKTYKSHPDPSKGELQADARFKYDQEFIIDRILPALLNRLIGAFFDLIEYGIDYSVCADALRQVQIHNSHLFEFSLETGLVFDADAVLTVKELYEKIEDFYLSTGVLTIEDKKRIWSDPVRPGDQYIKGANQVIDRFLKLYPDAKRVSTGYRQFGIKGLKFVDPRLAQEPADAKQSGTRRMDSAELRHSFKVLDGGLIVAVPPAIDTTVQPVTEPVAEPESEAIAPVEPAVQVPEPVQSAEPVNVGAGDRQPALVQVEPKVAELQPVEIPVQPSQPYPAIGQRVMVAIPGAPPVPGVVTDIQGMNGSSRFSVRTHITPESPYGRVGLYDISEISPIALNNS